MAYFSSPPPIYFKPKIIKFQVIFQPPITPSPTNYSVPLSNEISTQILPAVFYIVFLFVFYSQAVNWFEVGNMHSPA